MRRNPPILAPSILAADFTRLGEQVSVCVDNGIKWIHCDIMDGHFVPNISYGPMIVDAANKASDAFLDVHLMIYNPDNYVDAFIDAGADLISVHIEATPHIHRSIQNIKSKNILAGVAINPGTPISSLESVLNDVDLVVLMSVNPGFGGQKFIDTTYQRIKEMVDLRNSTNSNCLIEIDGGVGTNNIQKLVQFGADVLVAGSSVFSATDIPARIHELQSKMQLNIETTI
jgi:ribulose-phosphate 3-epimerase